jgi:tetratricopeptide (TPR) repeat protein
MSDDKLKAANGKQKPAANDPSPAKAPNPKTQPTHPPALFRKLDWITFGVTTLFVFVGYYLTLAPNLTLEDSGELAVGSYYAGVPHPPGYPVWTIYTWLFTLIPYSNIAWRVALSSAVAAALACGLLSLLVSRGSSLLLEGLADFKTIERRWESALCVVSGFVAGMMLGFNGFMWSQAVIVEVYTLSVLSFMAVLCCLLRWIYAPDQRRYLYWAFFWFGICFTNHQTLIVAAMGIEVAILAAQPKLGRDLFIGNGIAYVLGLMAKATGVLTSFDNNLPLFMIYNLVGLGSIAIAVAMTVKLGKAFTEWKPVLIISGLWALGASFYLFMPITSMTNPPMNWGYPRTVEGLKHAFSRGQYEQTNPTSNVGRFLEQLAMFADGAINEFSLVYLLIGLVPFLFYGRMQRRERAWLVGLTAIGICLGGLLLILLNPNTDLQSRRQARVFFTASHIVFAILIGYGLTLLGGILSNLYARYRLTILWCAAIASGIELYFLFRTFEETQYPTIRSAAMLGLGVAIFFTLVILVFRNRAPLAILLPLFAVLPARSVLSHWADNEQRGHLFGYWFGHDMFTPPFEVYPEMPKNAVLFGGTDPGRFNPTYMIFCESFLDAKYKPLDPKFDRRDVYLITQNALADKTYLEYIRAHYNRSEQKDPYFFSEVFRTQRDRDLNKTNLVSRAMLPVDRLFTEYGAKIEAKRREREVYPPKEIHTPSVKEADQSFQDYINDAARRLQHDVQFPNEPKQVKFGEGVNFTRDGRVQVSGQVAVMSINALLTKVIFDANPDHEFYVEESFPLDWMFPYLTPYGVIMKINRLPQPTITEEMIRKDHEFWAKYSERLIGNWITYDTSVKEICDFAERTYLRHDFKGFKGDPKFARDDFAQKAFSKLRSAIAYLYWWRLSVNECPEPFRAKPEDQPRLLREAEFALKQSFALCPESPEALHKYVTLLVGSGRIEDAKLVAETSLKFDPDNANFQNYVTQLRAITANQPQISQAQAQFSAMEQQFRDQPTNFALGLQLAGAYLQMQRADAAVEILGKVGSNPQADVATLLQVAQTYVQLGRKTELDGILVTIKQRILPLEQQYRANTNNVPLAFQLVSGYLVTGQTNLALQLVERLLARPQADANTILSAATVYNQVRDWAKLQTTLEKLVTVIPTNPEAWYDLAAVQALGGKSDALASLKKALQLNQERLSKEPGAKDLKASAEADLRFASLRSQPEFQLLLKSR